MVMRDGQMISVKNQPGIVDEEFPLMGESKSVNNTGTEGQEELIPC
jgi:hypothetical protein